MPTIRASECDRPEKPSALFEAQTPSRRNKNLNPMKTNQELAPDEPEKRGPLHDHNALRFCSKCVVNSMRHFVNCIVKHPVFAGQVVLYGHGGADADSDSDR